MQRKHQVFSWGSNIFGQCGVQEYTTTLGDVHIPEEVIFNYAKSGRDAEVDGEIHRVAVSTSHSMAVSNRGHVYAWGRGKEAQLGNLSTDYLGVGVPQLVKGLLSHFVIQVACGATHSLAMDNNGVVFSWGKGSKGQLGQGRETTVREPRQIMALNHVSSISCGFDFSVAIATLNGIPGAVFSFGNNNRGQLGLGDFESRNVPEVILSMCDERAVGVACGDYHLLVLLSQGVLSCGESAFGRLGLPKKTPLELKNEKIKAPSPEIGRRTLAAKARAEAFAEHVGHVPTLTRITEFDRLGVHVIKIAAGGASSAAISTRKQLYTWGSNGTCCPLVLLWLLHTTVSS